MASGVDGPGGDISTSPADGIIDNSYISATLGPSPNVSAANSGSSQFTSPGGEDAQQSTPPSNRHLSFSDLMSNQDQLPAESASDIRRMSGGGVSLDAGVMPGRLYNPQLHSNTTLTEEMEKVFEDEPYHLKMDFTSLGTTGEANDYPAAKYSEGDFSSHRRSQVHMAQPMTTHLSSHELRTIQSARNLFSGTDSTKRRRHRSSSSSGSGSHGSVSKQASQEEKHIDKRRRKKGGKKKRKNKRKLFTESMRNQTQSIPEEDEDEESEDEESDEEQEDEDSARRDEDDDFDGYGASGKSGYDSQQPDGEDDGKRDGKSSIGEQSKNKNLNKNENSLAEGKVSADLDAGEVTFTLGFDTPVKGAAAPDEPLKADEVFKKPDHPQSFTSLRSMSDCSSACSMSERDVKDDLSIENEKGSDAKQRKSRKKHRHHHHHKRRHKHEDANERRLMGDQRKEAESFKVPKLVIGSDDEEELGVDRSAIESHRFEDRGGIRKHLLHRPVKKRKARTEVKMRSDHKPHEVFVELDELVSGEWKETARWIKFEEDVEESQMWGKPRVASLSFHSLLELRKTIEKGAVMLDVDHANLSEVANAVVEEMVNTGQIKAEDQGNVLKVLLSKHNHTGSSPSTSAPRHIAPQAGFPYNLSQANFSSFFNPSYASRLSSAGNASSTNLEVAQPLMTPSDVEKGSMSPTSDTLGVRVTGAPSSKDLKIMKKIPEGAEATAVLVGTVDYLEQPTMAFVRLSHGTNLENVVALPIPVRFVFVLLGPNKPGIDYHEIGRSISTLMADEEFHVMAYGAENRGDLLRAINEFLDDSIVLPPGQLENPDLLKNISLYQKKLAERREKKKGKERSLEEGKGKSPPPPDDDPLKRTGRFFGGLVNDVKRRYPKYLSDITDAFNLQCLASIIFIYFAALSPAITFGGLLGEKTDGWMGVSEMILGCCIAGCTFGLFSGQPLLIVGSTGPVLVFEEAVYKFCGSSELPFLAVRFWIGIWIAIICFVVAMFEGSFLVRFVSRFTQEIFSALISAIFIFETFNKLAKTYLQHPLQAEYPYNETALLNEYNCSTGMLINDTSSNGTTTDISKILNQPNTALLSTLLMFGTFMIAYFLRQFKNSKFFRSSVRRTIGDFGVPIAIFAMLMVDLSITDTYTQKLNVPKGISPTDPSKRGWLVNPLGDPLKPLPVWMIFAAILPAFLVFILIFMESHITEMIVSAKERRLKKGTGFHLNIVVLGILNAGLSVFGMPWVCCATVRSITHTNSLTIMSKTLAPGEKPRIEGLHEQRITVFAVNALLGLSILMQPLLTKIPLAVLFGIFLYMGVTSLTGVQFIDRIEMLFMPSKHYPDYSYVKAVRPYRIHIFTAIEIACLVVLWVVKSTPAQIAFPFFLVLTIPLRYFILPRIFTKKELKELDNSDAMPSVTSHDKDEYNDANMPD